MSNGITLTGNLVDDPEEFEYGSALDDGSKRTLSRFRIGNSERGQDGKQYSNGFFDVVAFGPMARNIMESLHKGDRVIVSGRLQQQEYEREDGGRGYAIKVLADAVGASMEFGKVTAAVRTPSQNGTGIIAAIAKADSAARATGEEPRINPALAEALTLTGLRKMAKEAGLSDGDISDLGSDKEAFVAAINAA